MSDDLDELIDWLRNSSSEEWCAPMLNKAANKIMVLRRALTEICRIRDVNTPQGAWRSDLQQIARRALEKGGR